MNTELRKSIQSVPPGAWAVGVSGGADSVALLRLLKERGDLSLRVVHLDHQTRRGESAVDAEFVRQLAEKFKLPCDVSTFDQIISGHPNKQRNRSGRFRAARLAWFGKVVREHSLRGVILAHHADDQAETVLLRMLRGSGYRGLGGMSGRSVMGGNCGLKPTVQKPRVQKPAVGKLVILRPMLGVGRDELREYLKSVGQDWREDSSNASMVYARNRVRGVLKGDAELSAALIELGESCRGLRKWVKLAPRLEQEFLTKILADLPGVLARESARRWLIERGVPRGEVGPGVVDRLILMVGDAASSPRVQFPGGITVRRRGGRILVG